MAFSGGDKFLYVNNGGGVFNAFAADEDGSLSNLGNMGSFPAGAAGIAAR